MSLPVFAHCDYPSAATLNALSTALASIILQVGDEPISHAVPYRRELVGVSGYVDGNSFAMHHVHRYLHYKGTGTLTDMDRVQDEVTLSENLDGRGRLDLSAVLWLYPGAPYRVEGVEVCMEDDEP